MAARKEAYQLKRLKEKEEAEKKDALARIQAMERKLIELERVAAEPARLGTQVELTLSAPLPLLVGQGLPPFDAITPEQVEQAIPALLSDLNESLSAQEARLELRLGESESLSWEEVMEPLHQLGERLRWSWGVVSHLNGVCNTPALREAHQQQQGAVGRRPGTPQHQGQEHRERQPVFQQVQLCATQRGRQATPEAAGQRPAQSGSQSSQSTDQHNLNRRWRLAIIAATAAGP